MGWGQRSGTCRVSAVGTRRRAALVGASGVHARDDADEERRVGGSVVGASGVHAHDDADEEDICSGKTKYC